jgi:hypothetical protein
MSNGISVSQKTTDMFQLRSHFRALFSNVSYYLICIYISTTGATGGAGTVYPSGAPEFIHGF